MFFGLFAVPFVPFLWMVAASLYWRNELENRWLFALTVFLLGLGAKVLVSGAWQSYELFGNVFLESVPPSEMASHLIRIQRISVIHTAISSLGVVEYRKLRVQPDRNGEHPSKLRSTT